MIMSYMILMASSPRRPSSGAMNGADILGMSAHCAWRSRLFSTWRMPVKYSSSFS